MLPEGGGERGKRVKGFRHVKVPFTLRAGRKVQPTPAAARADQLDVGQVYQYGLFCPAGGGAGELDNVHDNLLSVCRSHYTNYVVSGPFATT
jgi:hypothetical protein